MSQWRHNQSLRQVLPPVEDPLSRLSDMLNEALSALSDYSVNLLGIILVIPLYMCAKIVIRKVYHLFLER
ncbi:hypothetical protein [Paenibacillus kribbensis]|uniref:hypothetical protein n=1 Tax=Paenibacillus kribbensis TaxID=172713 RepID=UPI0021088B3C|nr:hypothetical protein [Paenibacillus kribbensis]